MSGTPTSLDSWRNRVAVRLCNFVLRDGRQQFVPGDADGDRAARDGEGRMTPLSLLVLSR